MNNKRRNPYIAFLTLLPIWLSAIIFSFFFSDCNGFGKQNATPRREAHIRIEAYDSTFTMVDTLPILFEINTSASITNMRSSASGKGIWFDLSYPRYNAILHCTFSHIDASTISTVINNRTERMITNSGANSSDLIELSNKNDIHCQMLITPSAVVTPLQILVTDSSTFVLSASLTPTDKSVTPEHFKPVIDYVKSDMLHLFKTINSH